jgi:hypothetical protein
MREGLEQLCVQILKLRVSEYNQHMHYKVAERWPTSFVSSWDHPATVSMCMKVHRLEIGSISQLHHGPCA